MLFPHRFRQFWSQEQWMNNRHKIPTGSCLLLFGKSCPNSSVPLPLQNLVWLRIQSVWHSQVWKWYPVNWRSIGIRLGLLGEQWILLGLFLLRLICSITFSIILLLYGKVLDVWLFQQPIVHLGLIICMQDAS